MAGGNKRYQLAYLSGATTDSAVYITCPRRGRIKSVTWAAYIRAGIDNVLCEAELSFASVGQQHVHDAIGTLSGWSYITNVGALGVDNTVIAFQDLMDIAVLPGDRLNLNILASAAGIACRHRIWVEIDES